MLRVTKAAIAEASLMAGDIILVPARDAVLSALARPTASTPREGWTRTERLAVDCLVRNQVFQANCLRSLVRKRLEQTGYCAFAYDGAVQSSIPLLKEVLGVEWKLQLSEGKPSAELEVFGPDEPVRLPMPRGEDVARSELACDPYVDLLLQTREALLGALQGYTLADRVPPQLRDRIGELAVRRRVA